MGTGVRELHRRAVGSADFACLPHDLVEAPVATPVQVVGSVVDRYGVGHTLDSESALGDPVGDSPRGAAEILVRRGLVSRDVLEAEDDVDELVFAIRRVHLDQRGTVVGHTGDEPETVAQLVELDRSSSRGPAKRLDGDQVLHGTGRGLAGREEDQQETDQDA